MDMKLFTELVVVWCLWPTGYSLLTPELAGYYSSKMRKNEWMYIEFLLWIYHLAKNPWTTGVWTAWGHIYMRIFSVANTPMVGSIHGWKITDAEEPIWRDFYKLYVDLLLCGPSYYSRVNSVVKFSLNSHN